MCCGVLWVMHVKGVLITTYPKESVSEWKSAEKNGWMKKTQTQVMAKGLPLMLVPSMVTAHSYVPGWAMLKKQS